ncbi:MAG: endonuclease/exonuclease/phosphatase family protein [Anaerolineales bacterium]
MDKNSRPFKLSGLLNYLLPALVTAFGLQTLRAFIPGLAWYLKDTVGIGTLSLIPYAFGTFFLGFLAPLLRRLFGDWGSLWVSAGGLAIVRLIEQFSRDPGLDFWLAIAGTGLFLNFLSLYVGHTRQLGLSFSKNWAYGFALGFALDTALRGIFGFRDLSFISGFLPLMLMIIIVLLIFWGLWREPKSNPEQLSDGTGKGAVLLLALGPFFVLQMLFLQSGGWVEEVTGLGFPGGFLIAMLGYLAGVGGLSLGFARPKSLGPLLAALLSIVLVYGFYTADQSGFLALVLVLLGQFFMGWGLAAISSANSPGKSPGLWRTTLSVTWGMVLFLALSFAYYAAQDIALPLSRESFPALAAALLGLFISLGTFSSHPKTESAWDFSGITAGVILVLVPLIYWPFKGSLPEPIQPRGYPVKVMSYNIHSAFNVAGSQDLETIAEVIENSGADIIGLQEVSRGRLMDGGADMPTWLSQRQDMPVVFQGTEEPIWGNAILSRYPILESGWGDLPREGSLIGRGYLWARIDLGEKEPLLVIVTHLHQVEEESQVRQAQVPVILEFWNEGSSTIFVGDLNATPDSPEMKLISEAGMLDAWSESGDGPGYTDASDDPIKRIDWIWTSPDLETSAIEVIQTQASDNMPVLAELDLMP